MIPVWMLDIDGVVNACTKKPPTYVWPRDQWREAKVMGLDLLVAQPVVDFIEHVHHDGLAEIRWLTTWMDDAAKVAAEFGLPDLPVADAPEFLYHSKQLVMQEIRWWKEPPARRVLVDEGRPLVWTDDDITWSLGRRGQDEMRTLGPVLFISPDDKTGLTPKHLRRIDDFLALHTSMPVAGEGED